MNSQQRELLDRLFEQAVDVPAGSRAAWLAEHCPDEEIRRELESLLHYAQTHQYDALGAIVDSVARSALPAAIAEGEHFGPYRILGAIGQGGMGTVYRAVRDDDEFRKVVAVKVLRLESRTSSALRRFRQERQILANLEHPNIARLLDGGTDARGVPYIAMEYVEGEPVTAYCARLGLTADERVRLFRKVCEAVQYAHQMLVVHRDIKPGNILVTSDGVPKLLDFGIAKLLDAADTNEEPSTRTLTGFHMMTPDYASPEQVRGETVTTAADTYSLGAVLYELLTGVRPHRLKTYDAVEIARQVCQEPVTPPSSIVGTSLRGDLDNILLKAMQKEPARRYASVEQFSEDLGRYLDGRPVIARPDTLAYRAGKYLRRHRWGVASALAVLAALTVGMVAERRQARLAAERFELVRGLAHKLIFDVHSEVAKLPGSTKPREILVSAAVDYLDKLSKTAGDDPALLGEMAQGYLQVARAQGYPAEPNLGRPKDAVASLGKAIALAERAARLDPARRAELAEMYLRMATLSALTGAYGSAEPYARKGMDLAETLNHEKPGDKSVLMLLAASNATLGDRTETEDAEAALAAYWKCRAYQTEIVKLDPTPENRVRIVRANVRVGTGAYHAGQLGTSTDALAEAESGMLELLREEPKNPVYQRQMALTYQSLSFLEENPEFPNLGNPAKAIDYARKYVAFQQAQADANPDDANGQFSLSMSLLCLTHALRHANPAESLRAVMRSRELIEKSLERSPGNQLVISRRGRVLMHLGRALLATGDAHGARQAALEGLEVQRKVAAASPSDTEEQRVLQWAMLWAAEALDATGDKNAAGDRLREAADHAETLLRHQPPQLPLAIAASYTFRACAARAARAHDLSGAASWLERNAKLWREWKSSNPWVDDRRREAAAVLRAGPAAAATLGAELSAPAQHIPGTGQGSH